MRSSTTFVTVSLLASIAVVAAAPYESELYARDGELVTRQHNFRRDGELVARQSRKAKARKAKAAKINNVVKTEAQVETDRTKRQGDKAQKAKLDAQLVADAKDGKITADEVNKDKAAGAAVVADTTKLNKDRANRNAAEKALLRRELVARQRAGMFAGVMAGLRGKDKSLKNKEKNVEAQIAQSAKVGFSFFHKACQLTENAQTGDTAALGKETQQLQNLQTKDKQVNKERGTIRSFFSKKHKRSDLDDLLLEARAHQVYARDLEAQYLEARDAHFDLEERDEIFPRGFWDSEIDELD
ncbi:hypothetical protein C8J56DRAFT_889627 [Mycena floridula]|nr:hypothetical protein C8J56DRAFT_889627 [Mycena floridula]